MAESLSVVTKVVNTAMVLLIAYGLWHRRRPRVHIPVMLTAFAVDLANVLAIELLISRSRTGGTGAVEQGITLFVRGGPLLQQVHVAVSFLCVLGYVVAAVTGTRLWRTGKGRRLHRANALVFIATRLSSYVTSFWM
ncbi:MAG: hypothetical protein HY721_19260 [Planctomycetes bacterium]|nr:hypothetical protein [Planctomycetota bacterium]